MVRPLGLQVEGSAHTRDSAPALRQAVASWLSIIDEGGLDIRAQNARVADHYMAQFPQLRIVGRDWTGQVRLGILADGEKAAPVG